MKRREAEGIQCTLQAVGYYNLRPEPRILAPLSTWLDETVSSDDVAKNRQKLEDWSHLHCADLDYISRARKANGTLE